MSMANFTERVKNFWDWFAANEERLSEFAQNRESDMEFSERLVAFVNGGTALLGEGLNFNMGGDHEFTFAVGGKHPLFFLLPYVTANLPEQFRNKWKFFSCMQGTGGEKFEFRMHDAMVDSDNVMVSAVPNKEGNTVNLRFYAKGWKSLEDMEYYSAFFTLMDICIGEALSASCIGEVKRADKLEKSILSPKKSMFPLTQLERWLLDHVCENGNPPDPAQNYCVYSFEPQENTEPRFDIFTGNTNCRHLISDYYAGEESYYNTLSAFGAKPIFLSFCYNGETDRDEVFQQRNDLMDMLEEKVLGKCGSGKEIGIMLGGAIGLYRVYIDILLFDEQAFIEKAKPLLEKYQIMFFREDFVRSGQEHLLFDYSDFGFDGRLNQLHDAGFHDVIAELLEALPEEEKNYILTGIYARALINLEREADAAEVLESIRGEGESDPLWHYRYGCVLYYTKRPKEALEAFRRVKELDSELEGADEFIAMCKEELSHGS